jgi:hypothetical protein
VSDLPAPPIPSDADLSMLRCALLDRESILNGPLSLTYNDKAWRAGVTLRILSFHQKPAGSLPDDDRELVTLLMGIVNLRSWRRIRPIALSEWTKCSDGRLYNLNVSDAVVKVWSRIVAMRGREIRRLEMTTGDWAETRSSVFRRDDFTCQYCGRRGVALECDHVLPVSKGGRSVLTNLTTSCKPCNRSKGSRLLSEWRQ